MQYSGALAKMDVRHADPVEYALRVADARVPLNGRLGETFKLEFSGDIYCIACGRKTRKSFNQGYCFPCFKSRAACDRCILRPELCHYHAGTCREPAWGESHCMQPHVVYIANASGPKVGITRASQVPVRWIDQGAIQAMPVMEVANRFHSGLVESLLKETMNDRTDWRAMLRNDAQLLDLDALWRELAERHGLDIESIRNSSGADSAVEANDREVREFRYPVLEYPAKVRSIDADKNSLVRGTLLGIKGQYLILDTGVINIRKYTGYEVTFES